MFALIEQTEPQGNLHITKGFHFLVLIIMQWLTRDFYLCEAGTWCCEDAPFVHSIAWSLLIQEKALTPPCVLVYSYASWPLAGIFWTADVCLTAGLCSVELRQSLGRPLFLICNPPHMHFASVSFLITETGSNLRQEGFILDCGFKGYGLSWQRRPGSVETHGSRHRGNSLPTLPQTRK